MQNVIWITGLSAAGKTTLANGVKKSLLNKGYPTIILDGDNLRDCFNAKDSNRRDDRKNRAFTYSKLARMLSEQNLIVIVGAIALFKEIHKWNKENIDGYFEVFLNTPLDVLKERDPKKLYEKFDKGEIKDVAGLDIEVDFPESPDLEIVFKRGETPDLLVDLIVEKFFSFRSKRND